MDYQPNHAARIVDKALKFLSSSAPLADTKGLFAPPQELQKIINRPGLTLLAARPAMGTTALALNLSVCMAKHHKKTVLYFSFDSSKETLVQRILCSESFVDSKRLWDNNIQPAEQKRFLETKEMMEYLPLHVYDDPLLTVAQIGAICDKFSDVGLVVIDTLRLVQYIPGQGYRPRKRAEKENRILRQLSTLSGKKHIPILCLYSLGRSVENRMERIPGMCDIQEFRPSFDYLDNAIFLYREDYYDPYISGLLSAECYIPLNRRGDLSRVSMHWFPQYLSFISHDYLCGDFLGRSKK